jgi:hypothetical protein
MTGYPIINRITRGIYVTLQEMNLAILVIPFVYVFLAKNKKAFILVILFTTQILYSIYVGGDAWEFFGGANRYIAIAMPLFFVCLISAVYAVRKIVMKENSIYAGKYSSVEIFILLFLFLSLNAGSDNMLLYATGLKTFPTVGENINQIYMAKSLSKITKPNEKIAIVMAGVTPYFLPDRRFVDLLGKSDKVIAHGISYTDEKEKGLKQYISYRPGHMKWNYPYVVSELRPDVFGQIWPESEVIYLKKDYEEYISPEGYGFYIHRKHTRSK